MGTRKLKPAIEAFCQKWNIVELAVFGSFARDDAGPHSDVDVLVTFTEDSVWTLFDLLTMKDELKAIFDREVDLISRRGLEMSRNHIRKQAILSSAKVLYAA
ncbi:MAG: nucleotidyltransferase domain-containing protein [Nitrospinae bacterium]|nr:nucleotidyltransferase domain-containing protein [Nitrospinota bacterium]MBF0633809.1 nucleotidyltransferase domain-containing protein [Nitrospinota bacterium]